MFTVYCSNHGGQVLLSPDNIEVLADDTSGRRLHWRCTCGQTGVETIATSANRSGNLSTTAGR